MIGLPGLANPYTSYCTLMLPFFLLSCYPVFSRHDFHAIKKNFHEWLESLKVFCFNGLTLAGFGESTVVFPYTGVVERHSLPVVVAPLLLINDLLSVIMVSISEMSEHWFHFDFNL